MSDLFFTKRTGNDAPNLLIFTEAAGATYMLAFHYICELLHRQKRLNFAAVHEGQIPGGPSQAAEYISKVFKSFPPTAVIFSRFAHSSAEDIFKRHRPCVYHLDDNFFSLPPSFRELEPLHSFASRGLEHRRYLAQNADCILASTAELERQLKLLFPAQRVTSLLYPPYLASTRPAAASERKQTVIGYFGSLSHQRDLDLAVPALVELLRKNPALRFETLGPVGLPDPLRRFGEQTANYPAVRGYEQFLKRLAQLRWDIGLAPLEQNEFTRAKSVVKVLQYTALGIPVVASDVPPYAGAFEKHCVVFAENGRWQESIESLLDDPAKRTTIAQNAAQYCASRYSLEKAAAEFSRFLSSVNSGVDWERS